MASTSAESLAELGAQIGGIFERRSQEAQFRNSLPVMQTAFRQAIQDFDQGRSAAGYARIMDVAMQNPNNPFIQNMAQTAFKIGQAASDDYMARQRMMRTGGGGGGGGGGLTEQQMEEYLATGTVSEGIPAVSAGAVPATGAMQPAAPTTAVPQQAQIVEPETMPEEREVDEDYKVTEGEQRIDTPWLNQFGVAGVVGPAEYEKKVPKISKRTTVSSTGLISKGKTEEEATEKVNVKESEDFRKAIADGQKKFAELQSNSQLKKIFNDSGKNFSNMILNEEGSGQNKSYTVSVINPQTGEASPEEDISDGEYNTLQYFTRDVAEFINRPGVKIVRKKEEPAQPAAPATQPTQARMSLEEIARGGAAQPSAQPTAASARELTLEERIAAKTTTAAPTRTATREQIAGVKAGQVRQQRSTLESEKTRLERSLYETPRAGGGRKLKRGLTAQDPDVKAALDRIAAINKQLEAL